MAVAVETIADLSVSLASECSRGEEIAKRAVKTRDFTVDAVLEVLRNTKIPLRSTRDNVLPVGVDKVQSMLLGLYCHGPNCGVSTATKEMPWTVRLLIGTFRRAFPWFPVTSIQVNSGFASRPHVDKRNRGPSVMIALGENSGGEL